MERETIFCVLVKLRAIGMGRKHRDRVRIFGFLITRTRQWRAEPPREAECSYQRYRDDEI